MKSPAHRLADVLLDQPLADYVADRRRDGASWRRISLDLRDDTDGQVDITYETLRAWFPELVQAVES